MTSVQDENAFWEIIERSKPSDAQYNSNAEQHLNNLIKNLANFHNYQLFIFEKILQEKLSELYTADISELAIVLECNFSLEDDIYKFDNFLSDDGFIYFRCWLILQGKKFIEDIQNDIQNFVSEKYRFNLTNLWAEGLLYVTDEAYKQNQNSESATPIRDAVYDFYPEINYDFAGGELKREIIEGNELQNHYPILVKKICELRSK